MTTAVIDVYAAYDMHQNQIKEHALDNVVAFPGSPVVGQVVYLTTSNVAYYWNGTTWVGLGNSSYQFAQTIGDGVALVYTVTHNLGTLDTIESVYAVSTGIEEVAVVTHATINTTTFTFTVPPVLNSVRVVIHA